MDDSSDSERPAKRLKASRSYQRPQPISSAAFEPSAAPPVMGPDTFFGTWISPTGPNGPSTIPPSLNYQQAWQPTAFELPPSQVLYAFPPEEPQNGWREPQPSDGSAVASPEPGRSFSASTSPPSQRSRQLPDVQPIAAAPATPSDAAISSAPTFSSKDRRSSTNSKAVATKQLVSPFHDCLDQFGKFAKLQFRRPNDGFVNGYIKFRWAGKSSPQMASSQPVPAPADSISWAGVSTTVSGAIPGTAQVVPMSVVPLYSPATSDFPATTVGGIPLINHDWSPAFTSPASSPELLSQDGGPMAVQSTNPRMLPPQFGLQAKMETFTDRKFWEFYIQNWCPGRSVLHKTNLWLRDFAPMHEYEGVRAAIQCLAGVYIYDYVPQQSISNRINQLFGMAERRLTTLLNDPDSLQADQGNELITIAVILSMQDVVLTERRRKKPHTPRWLEGFLQSEAALQATDPGSRFWRANDVQLSSLRVSQSIIVGRSVILAQPMMPLPSAKSFDPTKEASRFGWLLYGKEDEMFAIHGGCGFSKKLLHVLSQITYCAARLKQESESPVPPMTARFLLQELQEMRQWNDESGSWERAKAGPQTIEWVRTVPDNYIIDDSNVMTDVTAEAWRLAALVYLQCRALRLPRNHCEVLANLTDLATCIRIMPTSGHHFTAQAPLLPVFLLGVTATDPGHRRVSRQWFEQVVQTPVRSSVPPLFETLQDVWSWINDEIPLDHQPPAESVAQRDPWWERLVERVVARANETLCLT